MLNKNFRGNRNGKQADTNLHRGFLTRNTDFVVFADCKTLNKMSKPLLGKGFSRILN